MNSLIMRGEFNIFGESRRMDAISLQSVTPAAAEVERLTEEKSLKVSSLRRTFQPQLGRRRRRQMASPSFVR